MLGMYSITELHPGPMLRVSADLEADVSVLLEGVYAHLSAGLACPPPSSDEAWRHGQAGRVAKW